MSKTKDEARTPWEQKLQARLDEAGPFFAEWVKELEITVENNSVPLTDPDRDAIGNQQFTQTIFEEDKHGNVVINFWNLNGETVNYWLENKSKNSYTDKYKTWAQTRLKEPKDGGGKYLMPKGQGHIPFLPWPLVEKFRAGEKVETLYLTEGAKKAFLAANRGVDVVGLPSITCYREADGELYTDLARLIDRCQVQHVVVLWDADCRDISLKAVARAEELTKRPFTFLKQAENIRKLVRDLKFDKTRDAPRVHFMHPNRGKIEGDPKGLDDLLVAAKGISDQKLTAVLQDMKDPTLKGEFFFRMEITTTSARLARHFSLKRDEPEKFYELHAERIGHNSFFYYGNLYNYISATEGLDLVAPEWASNYLWVGDDFFMKCEVPSSKKGMSRYKLLPRKKETIAAVTGFKDFPSYLTYHTGFANMPAHFNYQGVVEKNGNKFYNRYFPFEHVPETGDASTILDFVKHIFGTTPVTHPLSGLVVPRYEMGLDYIQILLERPTQMLPVLCLYSSENNTGKSTFCKLLAQIFRNNAIFVSNNDLQSDFNAVFVDKLVVMCEETLLERRKDTERIKALSTADEVTVNEKNVSQYTIDFFTKFIFCSNHRRMIYLTSHDERFWIIQVPKAKKENPHLLKTMIEEIPAFLDFLKQRKIVTNHDGRMWFHADTIRTENFYQTVETNEPGEVSNVRHAIQEMFDIAGPDEEVIKMPMKFIKEEFFSPKTSDKWVAEILRDYLGVVQEKDENGRAVYERGAYTRFETKYQEEGVYQEVEKTVRWKGRPYVFQRSMFMSEPATVAA